MMLDVIIAGLGVVAVFRGLKQGLVLALFALIGIIAGLAAATKLSAVVANRLSETGYSWLPFFSFFLVFIVVVFCVNLFGRLIQQTVQWTMMGWLNRLGGVVFYLLLYAIVISIFLFYLTQMNWLDETTGDKSFFYQQLYPLGPGIIEQIGKWIPLFKDIFIELQQFFGTLEDKI